MRILSLSTNVLVFSLLALGLSSCATTSNYSDEDQSMMDRHHHERTEEASVDYAARMPSHIKTGEKVVVVDPRVHAFGAYDANGDLVRAGLATAGSHWCSDIGRPCQTKPGVFHVQSLGSPGCKSTIYPLPRGGAPMPYCMFFDRNQGLHGSYEVVDGNISHGCVRLHVEDAKWLRYNFVHVGTKVIVKSYH